MVVTHLYRESWFQLKLVFVAGLVGYHLFCGYIRQPLLLGRVYSSMSMRILNEVPVFFLVGIVLIVCLKEFLNGWVLASILGVLGVLVAWGMNRYRCQRHSLSDCKGDV